MGVGGVLGSFYIYLFCGQGKVGVCLVALKEIRGQPVGVCFILLLIGPSF